MAGRSRHRQRLCEIDFRTILGGVEVQGRNNGIPPSQAAFSDLFAAERKCSRHPIHDALRSASSFCSPQSARSLMQAVVLPPFFLIGILQSMTTLMAITLRGFVASRRTRYLFIEMFTVDRAELRSQKIVLHCRELQLESHSD
jgi:hypothetical protein